MRYLGGKSRLAKQLVACMPDRPLRVVEPFVGAFNLVPMLSSSEAECSDIHCGLIEMYRAVQAGWLPQRTICEQEYRALQQGAHCPARTFFSFAASFAGIEWGGFARDATGKRDLAAESVAQFMRKVPYIKSSSFRCCDYREVEPRPGDVVYCDPPYMATTGYKVGRFDTAAFVKWCNGCADRGCQVYVSEFSNLDPSRWSPVWSKRRITSVAKTGESKTELLLKVAT